jgi:hypothetical protein
MNALVFGVTNVTGASFSAVGQVITDQVNNFILDKKLDKKTLAMYSAAAGVSAFVATAVLGHVTGYNKIMGEVVKKIIKQQFDEEFPSLLEKAVVPSLIVTAGAHIIGPIGGKVFIDNATDKSLSWKDVGVLKTTEITETLILQQAAKALVS